MVNRREEDRYAQLLHEVREMRKDIVKEQNVADLYSKDFIYYTFSMLVPVGYGKSYVARHIRSLLWRSALCGADDAGPARKCPEPPPMPHNSHQKLQRRGSPVWPDRQTFPIGSSPVASPYPTIFPGSGLPYNRAMHKYAVSLRISSAALDVAQVTSELGLAPTQTRKVGERKSAGAVWDKALWELEVFPEGRSDWDSLEAGLAALLKIFVPLTKALQEYSKKHDVFLWCGHFSSSLDGGPHLSAEILKALGAFGVPLWFDAYSSDK